MPHTNPILLPWEESLVCVCVCARLGAFLALPVQGEQPQSSSWPIDSLLLLHLLQLAPPCDADAADKQHMSGRGAAAYDKSTFPLV